VNEKFTFEGVTCIYFVFFLQNEAGSNIIGINVNSAAKRTKRSATQNQKGRYEKVSSPLQSDLFKAWRAFLENPETFPADLGHDNLLCILTTKKFLSMKLYYAFKSSYLKDILK